MNLDVRPILSALMRNRTGAFLVALQIAIALAVLVNAVYVVKQRVDKVSRPTGLDEANTFVVASSGFAQDFDYPAALREDLAYLRSVPGVVAATAINAVPLSGGGSSTGVTAKPSGGASARDSKPTNVFWIDEQGLEALGVRLIAGRAFRPDEILPPPTTYDVSPPSVIVTQALAKELFPDTNALGKPVYDSLDRPSVIVGIVEHMHGSWVSWDKVDNVSFIPIRPIGPSNYYLVRTSPGQRDAVMRTVEEHLAAANPRRVIAWVRTLEQFKARSYRNDRNMAIFLVSVTGLLLGITALGIFGLATFNVSTRTKQIGTRRAIGARRFDIVRYFLVENGLITTAGIVVGCALALGVGFWLSVKYQLPRLDLYYLVAGVLGLWFLGQVAVWQPARRAATVSPAVATRTV